MEKMTTIRSEKELEQYLDKDGNLIVNDDLTVTFDLKIEGDINVTGVIIALDIKALNIKACDIKAFNIDVRRDIKAENISYHAVCFAYKSFKCKRVKGRRENSKHFCLDQDIEIINT